MMSLWTICLICWLIGWGVSRFVPVKFADEILGVLAVITGILLAFGK